MKAFKDLRFTKIVATVAGDSCTKEFLQDLYDRGMDVVRMNSAHMSVEEMDKVIMMAREVSPNLAVMIDTKGPNIRTCGVPADGLSLKKGQTVKISGKEGDDGRIQVNYPPFTEEVPVGSKIVCDDGAAKLTVTGKDGDVLIAEPLFDCVVRNKKSVNVPDVSMKAPALTDKDRMFLAEAVRMKCDLVAHSFVRNAADVMEVRKALGEDGKKIGIIAKIENREGVQNLHEILETADGIMVARGDLGIEIPLEEVPAIQKKMIHEARKMAKPVITATQMLQSMETSPLPTRAEVSDVANAVYDGTDAVMLSGETSHGDYPREAVDMMRRIVMEAEEAPAEFFPVLDKLPESDQRSAYILAAAAHSSAVLPVKVIICCTMTGISARVLSAFRPKVPLFVPTPDEITMRKLALNYGVFSCISEYSDRPVIQVVHALELFKEVTAKRIQKDDLLMLVCKNAPDTSRNNVVCLGTLAEMEFEDGVTEKIRKMLEA